MSRTPAIWYRLLGASRGFFRVPRLLRMLGVILRAIAATGRDGSNQGKRRMSRWIQFRTQALILSAVCAAFAAIVFAGPATAAARATARSVSSHRAVASAAARVPRKGRNSAKKKGGGLGQAECSSLIGQWCYYAFINDTRL
jgi:hypothetical protein